MLLFLAYLFIKYFVVNYRPVLIEGVLEASYPSSTTMLMMCIMPTAIMQFHHLISSKRLRNIEGKDTAHTIIIVPTGIPKLSEALNNAFEKSDTDIMTDVNVKKQEWYIPYIYGQSSWIVKGDAIKTRNN